MQTIARHARRYPDLRAEPLDDQGLSLRDGALAHAILDQSVRRWITLVTILQRRLKRPFGNHSPAVQSALLAGSAQLLLFDRLPAYAVVDETVEWVKSQHGRKSAGLVNAILRRVMESVQRDGETPQRRAVWTNQPDELPLPSGEAVALREPELPENDLDRIAVATGMPRELLAHIARTRSVSETQLFALHGITKPPVILNTSYAADALPESNLLPHDRPGHHVFSGSAHELHELLSSRSDLWAQDPTSSAACLLAAGLKPRFIVDVCAGQGTKTRQLRAMFPDAEIVATDINDERRRTLKRVFDGDSRVRAVEPNTLEASFGRADLVLIDAPCTNTGVLARRIEARHRWSEKTVRSLVDAQRQILADSVRLLAPGGAILYATCSVDSRENEDQAAWLAKWHQRKIVRSESRWPSGGPGRPTTESNDGGFAALLR